MGACSISSLRTFYICRGRQFVTIPANIKFLLTNYRLKKSLYVKLKDGMTKSVDPDETATMGRFIWIYAVCKSLLLSLVAVKVKKSHYCSILPVTLKIY